MHSTIYQALSPSQRTADALLLTNGSNGLRSAPQPAVPPSLVARPQPSDAPFIRPSIYPIAMAHGFTDWQFKCLTALLSNRPLPAKPAAPTSDLPADLPSAPTPAPPSALSKPPHILPTSAPKCELPLQPIPAPIPARSYSAPSVETMKEVEHPLRDIRLMKKKLGASNIPVSQLLFDEICIGWPTKFGESNMLFSRDKNPDAWYTTMLNTHAKAQQL